MKSIKVFKAKVHNLKSIDVEIPKDSLTVITGPSGSGKSSLAFDTIYAEGQRRYIESLSSYARQFLGQIEPADVESIEGLSPAIAIDQKTTSKNPRSTVGTVTEIYDYLRVLYARIGTAHCPESGEELAAQSAQQMVETLLKFPENTKMTLLAPVFENQKGEHKEMMSKFLGMGFSKIRLDGKIIPLEADLGLKKNTKHTLDVVIDRIIIKDGVRSRLNDSVEYALKTSGGKLIVSVDEQDYFYSEKYYSHKSGKSYPELEPRLFSFNSPLGACPKCNGLGVSTTFDKNLLLIDNSLSINDGAIGALARKNSFLYQMVKCIAKTDGIDLDAPFKNLPKSFQEMIFDGGEKIYTYSFKADNSRFKFKKRFIGVLAWLERRYNETDSEKVRANLVPYMRVQKCVACSGKKLTPYALATTIENKSIMDVCLMPVDECYDFFIKLDLKGDKAIIAKKLLKEIRSRIKFLLDVGLNYLTLNREAMTLSGGESQRIRLATQVGSALTGVLYVLDEPSIGLHQRDNERLIKTLINLRDIGNTVLVVEHDEDMMKAADHVIDMGPGAGIHGGEVVVAGNFAQICQNKKSLTGQYLSHKLQIETPKKRRQLADGIWLKGAKANNVNDLDLHIPLGGLVVVSGVSGSGKSTLINQILVPAVTAELRREKINEKNFKTITGLNKIDSIIELDQSPIGRTPKSNPATYAGFFDDIRTLYSLLPESKIRGYKPGRFSFNVKGGRCETCEGAGVIKIEMNFLADVYITCSECFGKRYNQETLSILFKGRSIFDILDMSIEEATEFFTNQPRIHSSLKVLFDLGLGYMKLGQAATTLSGGEAQRLKLAKELSKRAKGHCLYVLDEPTTGLHFHDIKILMLAVNQLIEKGHTVVIIEHNLDVIKLADWVIDLGPEGGKFGGMIVAEGKPEDVVKVKASHTGKYLRPLLNRSILLKETNLIEA